MEKNKEDIQLLITAEVTGSLCNFDCSYCYRKGQSDYDKNIKPTFDYSVEHMLKAFSKERIGGIAYICVIGGGETLIPDEIVPFIKGLLKEGHIVEVVTNLSLKNRIDELLQAPAEDLKRLLVKGSLHYTELKRLKKVDLFFDNMNRLIEAGASSYPLITIYDDYLPILEEIKQVCINKIGVPPHCIPAVKDFDKTMTPCDFYNDDFINETKTNFESGIFENFVNTLDCKPKDYFCYAGERSLVINLKNGETRKCFYSPVEGNIFKNIKNPIKLAPIGRNCPKPHCALLYSFLGMGVIPSIKTPSYSKLLDRKNILSEFMNKKLDFKFSDYQTEYTQEEQEKINTEVKETMQKLCCKCQNTRRKISFKNKLRLKIYNYLKTKLEKKGLV